MSPALRRRIRNRIGRGLTFDKVWATIERNAEEAEKRHAEWEAKWQKEAEERRKEAAEQEARRRKEHEETERIVKEVSRQMGGLHNSFGEMAEFMVAPGIIDLFNDLDFHITQAAEHGIKIVDEKKRVRAEIDLLMWNGDYIIAIEVKTSLGEKDIEKHRRRLEILREDTNKTGDRRKIVGGMAVAVLNEDDRKAILDAGFYLLEPSDYSRMKIDLPEGFVPREF